MDAATYLRSLFRSWWLVLLVILAGGAGGFLVYERATPLYSSSVTFIVASRSSEADEVSARTLSQLRAETIARVAPTDPVLAAVAEASGLSTDLSEVEVTAAASESFVTIDVSGPSPEVVSELAETYPEVIPDEVDRLAGSTGSAFRLNVVSEPELPTEPYAPDLQRNVGFGLLIGLVLGLALAVLRETLNRTVRDTDELRRLTGLPILGIVPKELPNQRLPSSTHPRSARAEAYRQVRTTLLNSSDRRPLAVAVTSATLGEGKTSVAANLAVVLSRAGHRVALVDADLRRPKVAEFLQVAPSPGLTEVLMGDTELSQALSLLDEGRFGVLPSGRTPTNPSEALGSATMQEVLRQLSTDFEFVIIDTPPVVPVTDALVLAPWIDGIVLVARLGQTTTERLERAQAAVDRVHARVFGIVANHAGKGSDADYSYTYKSKQSAGADFEEVPIDQKAMTTDAPQENDGPHENGVGRHSSSGPTLPVVDPLPSDDGSPTRRT